jgi:hypothetical protein
MRARDFISLILLSLTFGVGLSFPVAGASTPVGLSRAHAAWHAEPTPGNLARLDWERTSGVYIYQATLAATFSIFSFGLALLSHLVIEGMKRPACRGGARAGKEEA